MRIALLAAFPLHVIPGLEEHATGGHYATWLPQLAEAFEAAASEFDLHWLVMSKRPVPQEPIRWQNQSFHVLHNPERLRMLRAYRRDGHLIRQRLDQIAPDFVHAWGTEDCYGLAGAGSRRPWILSMQGILQEYIRRIRMHPFVYLQAAYEAFVLRRASEITVESGWGEAALRRLAPRARIHRVEYGVQPPFYAGLWEPDPNHPIAVFVGTPDPRKGIQDAVRAFADSKLNGAELRIVGDTHSRFAKKLRRESPPNVRWLGRLGVEQTAKELRRAWCLVLPTRADTSPNAVKEARVIGLPVVTTADGGQSDYIEDGANGFLVKPGDILALVEALAALLNDLGKARAMGGAMHMAQREHFRPANTAARFLGLYRELGRKLESKPS